MTEKESVRKHQGKEESEGASESKLNPGDMVLVEFDAWIEESNELFDTTSEQMARESNIYNEKMVYGAQPLIIGKGRLFPGLDEDMVKAEIGKEYEVSLPPDKAAGPRDPKLVELHPVREFLKQEIEPRVGLEVTVRNRPGTISAVTAGRVRVDFNNRLAGKTLRYKYKITEKPTKPKEIAELILKMSYGTADGFEIEHHGKNYRIVLPDVCKYDQKWILSKYRVVTDLREVLDAEKVFFVEEYAKPEEKEEKKPEKEEEQKAEEKEAEPEAPEAPEEVTSEPGGRAPEELTDEDRKG